MSEDVKVLTAIKKNILCIIDKYGAQPYDIPMDSEMYRYIQSEAQELVHDEDERCDPIAKNAIITLRALLCGVSPECIFEQLCKAREVLDDAIAKINKLQRT